MTNRSSSSGAGGAESRPAAIVVGDEDYATPVAMAETLCRGIKGSTLTILKGARHLTPLEAPTDIAAVLQRLIQLAPVR